MPKFVPFEYEKLAHDEQLRRAQSFFELCKRRRSIREFSSDPIPPEVLELIVQTASSAPSGANKQPWKFIVVTDSKLKKEIREAAEAEEKKNYEERMPQEWLDDLEPFGTDWRKEFLGVAPALIAVFAVNYEKDFDRIRKNYYVKESVGIAVGFLLAAIHNAGLVALTHTPSPMDFLQRILERPDNEKPFLLIPVGYPKDGTKVPDINKKSLDDIRIWR
ncbi:MAG: nitroreductase family protein [Ignavibacteria bacterium]|nr:nitroreductase family protein [Ignavibacteria bacterium]